MTTYLIHDANGAPVSIGTRIADPLPAGLTAVTLAPADADGLRAGTLRWDATTRALVAVTPDPTEVNRLTIEDRLRQALTNNATYLAIATPTAAQTTAQAKALTRQVSALIRHQLAGDLLADTTGT